MKIVNKLGCALILTFSASTAYSTEVLFDNLGASSGYGGADTLPSGYIANAFSTGNGTFCPNGCTLGNVTLEIQSDVLFGFGSINGFFVNLLSDNGGSPGSTIATLNNPFNPSVSAFPDEVIFSPQSSILLTNDSTYWIELSSVIPGTTENNIQWWFAASGTGQYDLSDASGASFFSGTGGPYKMRIEAEQFFAPTAAVPVSAVPLPPAFIMMGTALAGLLVRRNTVTYET